MLPTPHGPADAPVPAGAADVTVEAGRTVDEVALLRVVEHLAEVPDIEDGAEDPGDEPPAEASAGDEAAGEGSAGDETAVNETAVDETAVDETAVDETAVDEDAEDTAAPEGEASDVAGDEDAPDEDAPDEDAPDDAASSPDAAPVDVVGPVAAALSDTRHRIDELNPAERIFLAQQRALIGDLCPDTTDAAAVGALFDRVRAQWRDAEDPPDPGPLADAFGVALGDLVCAEAPDLGWATCADRFGTEIVLAREDPEVLVYPIAAVAQSWQAAAPGWFITHLANVVRGVVPDLTPTDV
ncbi:DUF3806 domain-containing protein [Cellulomonas sp. S1-8]|uniref:DUF3806 domain-containing protein n=1 Tax=Cellulomonas sp. S1-8 TaxID=2904790 RepID=UPI002243379F|nr:DUF3806 domain-containing protein [Cellulomonas sp. S1-8]UZN03989.1 DUF3806 domain-containing protein [Cellulomonas sp. S1-8]